MTAGSGVFWKSSTSNFIFQAENSSGMVYFTWPDGTYQLSTVDQALEGTDQSDRVTYNLQISGGVISSFSGPTGNLAPDARGIYVITASLPLASTNGPWQRITNTPTFYPSLMMLLTDGRVLVEDSGQCGCGTSDWWILTPDAHGNYVDGTWSQAASMPSGYEPEAFASAVLPDGKVIVEGGEYDGSSTWTGVNAGALYDPVANTWTAVAPPDGGTGCWANIADAPSIVLANGRYLLDDSGSRTSTCQALFNEVTLSWQDVGANKDDPNAEEGLSLLPNNNVLTVDSGTNTTGPPMGLVKSAEVFNVSTMTWGATGSTPAPLDDDDAEIGPQINLFNGEVLATGATGANALYDPTTGSWTATAATPTINGISFVYSDTCAAVTPSGDVLIAADNDQEPPLQWFLYDGATFMTQPSDTTQSADSAMGFSCNLLDLPNGQILQTMRGTHAMSLYTPSGSTPASARPVVTSVPNSLTPGQAYTLAGTQLNGLTGGTAYGDEEQNATNYPIVAITNTSSGVVTYARSYGSSYSGIGSGVSSTVNFAVPVSTPPGPSQLRVVASGVASTPLSVTVAGAVTTTTKVPSAPKVTTIVCVKGKVTRKVSGTSPRCPAGYAVKK
jgi:hypothetical protein